MQLDDLHYPKVKNVDVLLKDKSCITNNGNLIANKASLIELDDSQILTNNTVNKANIDLLNGINLISNEDELIKIVASVKKDLKSMYDTIHSSTEQLIQMKNKQLRHYFKKQINVDSKSTNCNTKHQEE